MDAPGVRVHQLARELAVTPREVIAAGSALGLKLKAQSSTIPAAQVERLKRRVLNDQRAVSPAAQASSPKRSRTPRPDATGLERQRDEPGRDDWPNTMLAPSRFPRSGIMRGDLVDAERPASSSKKSQPKVNLLKTPHGVWRVIVQGRPFTPATHWRYAGIDSSNIVVCSVPASPRKKSTRKTSARVEKSAGRLAEQLERGAGPVSSPLEGSGRDGKEQKWGGFLDPSYQGDPQP
jgi:hypothetical protein